MINIISKSIVSKETTGPGKVVRNLIKGLDTIGYPYCINKALDATSQLWIQDDQQALKKASEMKLKALIGPNLYIFPENIPANLDLSNFIYIHPSKWVVDFWKELGFNKCPLEDWPVGIDIKEFEERKKPGNGIVLIYFKQRYSEELDFVKSILEENNIKYEIISYGFYEQKQYRKKLKNVKYLIWLGKTESQGIALEEALSMNIPALVWDVSSFGHYNITSKDKKIFNKKELDYKNATSAYYFDEKCGIKTKNKNEIKNSIQMMEKEWENFKPREYILENLSLEKQAGKFIDLFDKYYNISYEEGKDELPKSDKKWTNDKFYFKAFIALKENIKKCVKLLKK